MKKYTVSMQAQQTVEQIICNGCGREIPLERADYFHGEKTWGYFSNQDGRRDSFDLCEDCYQRMVDGFAVKLQEDAGE